MTVKLVVLNINIREVPYEKYDNWLSCNKDMPLVFPTLTTNFEVLFTVLDVNKHNKSD